jgi:hypothetical protein
MSSIEERIKIIAEQDEEAEKLTALQADSDSLNTHLAV